jgi:hypothetical protein
MPTQEIIEALNYLLPGFIAAWVYYGLSAYQKPSQFERIIQALIFTTFVQVIVILIEFIVFFIGSHFIDLGAWNDEKRLVTSIVVALLFGISFSRYTNSDDFYEKLRKYKITKSSPFPSEWYHAFASQETYVVLHLSDGRRIYGWPWQWPKQSDNGYFSLRSFEWLDPGNTSVKSSGVDSILIPASEVKFVEFVEFVKEEMESCNSGEIVMINEAHQSRPKTPEKHHEQVNPPPPTGPKPPPPPPPPPPPSKELAQKKGE